MDRMPLALGELIVRAARMAVTIHLQESAGPRKPRRQVMIGRAGPHWITDDPTPPAPMDAQSGRASSEHSAEGEVE